MEKRCLFRDFMGTPGVMRFFARPRIRWADNVIIDLNSIPVVSLDFSVRPFLPTEPWPWGRLSP